MTTEEKSLPRWMDEADEIGEDGDSDGDWSGDGEDEGVDIADESVITYIVPVVNVSFKTIAKVVFIESQRE